MRRLSIVILFCLFMTGNAWSAPCLPRGTFEIPVNPNHVVHEGKDSDLSLRGCHLFAIKKFGDKAPGTLPEAEDDIISSMPKWMILAVRHSYGNTECVVMVNDLDYFGMVVEYYIDKWNGLAGLRRQVPGYDPKNYYSISDGLQELVCRKIKSM